MDFAQRSVLLAAVAGTAALLTLLFASPLGATGNAQKVVIRIDIAGRPAGGNPQGGAGTFVLRSGAVADTGSESYAFYGSPIQGDITLTGKHGELDLHTKSRPSGLSVDSQGLDLWTGTWSIASGTGSYAGAHAVGAYVGIIGPSYHIALHLEGFRTER